MEKLDKAYEAVDMLKALDLPISKAQLDDIERLEKEHGNVDNSVYAHALLRKLRSWIKNSRKDTVNDYSPLLPRADGKGRVLI